MIGRRDLLRSALLPCLSSLAGAARASDAAELIAGVRQRLAPGAVLRGEFEQRKILQGFRNALVSQGDFLLVRGRGIVWRTREPFASSLVVTRDRLVARQADGRVVREIATRDQPGLKVVNDTLFALMQADLDLLAQRFQVEGDLPDASAWRLRLVPRDPAIARFVASIAMDGDRFVRQVQLDEARGDSSRIRFSQQSVSAVPTAEEASRLD